MCKGKDGKIRFSAMEMISSGKTGQTSATGTIGVILCLVAMTLILAFSILYFFQLGEADHILDFLDKCIMMLGIGAALLGTRKISGALAGRRTSNIIKLVEDTMNGKASSNDECDGYCDGEEGEENTEVDA